MDDLIHDSGKARKGECPVFGLKPPLLNAFSSDVTHDFNRDCVEINLEGEEITPIYLDPEICPWPEELPKKKLGLSSFLGSQRVEVVQRPVPQNSDLCALRNQGAKVTEAGLKIAPWRRLASYGICGD